jgi:hypothetical protein
MAVGIFRRKLCRGIVQRYLDLFTTFGDTVHIAAVLVAPRNGDSTDEPSKGKDGNHDLHHANYTDRTQGESRAEFDGVGVNCEGVI